jgi:hypothetical protein
VNVAELRIILDHVPDDLEVRIWGTGHVTEVRRRTAYHDIVPALVLANSRWRDPADDTFSLSGPFRRSHELLLKLDPATPIGEPA